MNQYVYLYLSFFLCLPWSLFFYLRPDLRRKILKVSTIGGFAGLIAEFWYFKDYWQPPTLLGRATVSIEDFTFGFFITGIAVAAYDVVFKKSNIAHQQNRKRFFGSLFLTGVVSLFLFNNWLGFNSIFVSSITFILFTVVIVLIRKDLVLPALISGLLCLVLTIPIYMVLFNLISPTYWDSYGLLTGTIYGTTILGHVPLTELLWYFSWGCMAGVSYEFASGKGKK